jgi:hypothetical protein
LESNIIYDSTFFKKKALLKLNVDFDLLAIGAYTRDSYGKSGLRETPAGSEAARRLLSLPKASTWSGNQQARLTEPKN